MPRSTMSLMNAFTIADRTFPLSCWAEPHKTSVSSIPQQVPQDPLSIVSYLWPYFACCELSRSTFLAGECQRTCLPKENPKVCKCIPIVFQNSKKLFWRIALDEKSCCSENRSSQMRKTSLLPASLWIFIGNRENSILLWSKPSSERHFTLRNDGPSSHQSLSSRQSPCPQMLQHQLQVNRPLTHCDG